MPEKIIDKWAISPPAYRKARIKVSINLPCPSIVEARDLAGYLRSLLIEEAQIKPRYLSIKIEGGKLYKKKTKRRIHEQKEKKAQRAK